MKNILPIILGLGALIGGYFIITAEKIKGLIIRLSNIANIKFNSDLSASISFDLAIVNPNSKDFVFNSFYATISTGGKVIATINVTQNVILKGKGAQTDLNNIKANVQSVSLVEQLLTSGKLIVTVAGTLVAEGLKFPVNQQITLIG